jgi:hypothetical protein
VIYLDHDIAIGKFVKKLFGERKIEDALHRVDRLTRDEAHMTGTETLQVVHRLGRNLLAAGMRSSLHSLPIVN